MIYKAGVATLGIFFIMAGLNHFRVPDVYMLIMPPYLPWPRELVYLSGAMEMIGGAGVLVPAVRRLAGWGLMLLLLAVFPANVHMALHQIQIPGLAAPSAVLWLRLPLQAVMIALVWWVCVKLSDQSVPAEQH